MIRLLPGLVLLAALAPAAADPCVSMPAPEDSSLLVCRGETIVEVEIDTGIPFPYVIVWDATQDATLMVRPVMRAGEQEWELNSHGVLLQPGQSLWNAANWVQAADGMAPGEYDLVTYFRLDDAGSQDFLHGPTEHALHATLLVTDSAALDVRVDPTTAADGATATLTVHVKNLRDWKVSLTFMPTYGRGIELSLDRMTLEPGEERTFEASFPYDARELLPSPFVQIFEVPLARPGPGVFRTLHLEPYVTEDVSEPADPAPEPAAAPPPDVPHVEPEPIRAPPRVPDAEPEPIPAPGAALALAAAAGLALLLRRQSL